MAYQTASISESPGLELRLSRLRTAQFAAVEACRMLRRRSICENTTLSMTDIAWELLSASWSLTALTSSASYYVLLRPMPTLADSPLLPKPSISLNSFAVDEAEGHQEALNVPKHAHVESASCQADNPIDLTGSYGPLTERLANSEFPSTAFATETPPMALLVVRGQFLQAFSSGLTVIREAVAQLNIDYSRWVSYAVK
ncbi:unnamed protein product [Protopolystoma xenopodis]|uniref:Uncharacterized protein n=1 Tax=Protopolystoma xenopodis TaxID=117903 RepID=A0A3S5FDL8_9PLAT|nr:unnamed protein product [Protopolystoma xenopodis]